MIKYLAEFIGTFIFLSVILSSNGDAIAVAIGLAAPIFMFGAVSGAHFNPAVSLMKYVQGALEQNELPFYIVAQLLGGLAALYSYNEFKLFSGGEGMKGGAASVVSTVTTAAAKIPSNVTIIQ